ncbi:divergent polysaccharide deacetylase family protein [Kaarinaea lacus]
MAKDWQFWRSGAACECIDHQISTRLALIVFSISCLIFPSFTLASSTPAHGMDLPAISIIIDDLGNAYQRDKQAVLLPGAVTYSFLPHTRYSEELAELAHQLDKDVLLHLPMQATQEEFLDTGGLSIDMSHAEFIKTFQRSLRSVPHAVGVNNHMGSMLTQHPGHMLWLMQAISEAGDLFFIDSVTTSHSVAHQIATEQWVPNMQRDVFLDNDRNPAAIKYQFQSLLQVAQQKGIALAIGHPYPETLSVLAELIPQLEQQGIRLIPLTQLLKLHMKRFRTWRAFLSP